MAAALAVRRHRGPLKGEYDGQHAHNNSFGRSFSTVDFSNRTKSEQDATTETGGEHFPRTVDIVKDLEIEVLVGRKLFPFV